MVTIRVTVRVEVRLRLWLRVGSSLISSTPNLTISSLCMVKLCYWYLVENDIDTTEISVESSL